MWDLTVRQLAAQKAAAKRKATILLNPEEKPKKSPTSLCQKLASNCQSCYSADASECHHIAYNLEPGVFASPSNPCDPGTSELPCISLGLGLTLSGCGISNTASGQGGNSGAGASGKGGSSGDGSSSPLPGGDDLSNLASLAKELLKEQRAAEGWTRVGRWMSPEEYAKMERTGVVQWNEQGTTRMANPPNPAAYRAAPPGDIYVEYEVPTTALSPHSEGTSMIYGPDSFAAKLPGKAQPGDVPVRHIVVPG